LINFFFLIPGFIIKVILDRGDCLCSLLIRVFCGSDILRPENGRLVLFEVGLNRVLKGIGARVGIVVIGDLVSYIAPLIIIC